VREELASGTALGVAAVRAVHQLMDELPHMLEDPVSPVLLDGQTVLRIREHPELHGSPAARGLRSHVVLRSRYAEDSLRDAVDRGVRQYISLGAGYDTFAWRQPKWAEKIAILEIDHPATQGAKRALLKGKAVHDAGNVEYLPLDLERDGLLESLSRTSIRRDQPAWLSCLGVLAYLRRETIVTIFRAVASMPKGSGMVLAFAPQVEPGQTRDPPILSVAHRAAELGEPWLTRFSTAGLEQDLRESGFTEVRFLGLNESKEMYYKNRTDLPAPGAVRLCETRV
jgi:methyltransferase (TIGR00027 family)